MSDLTSGVLAAGEVSSVSEDGDALSVDRMRVLASSSSTSDVEEASSAHVLSRPGALGV